MERVSIIALAAVTAGFAALLLFVIRRFRHQAQGKRRELDAHRGRLDALERRHRAFIRALPDYYFILDSEGVYVDYSVPQDDALGMPRDSIVGRKISDVFDVPETGLFMDAVREVLSSGQMHIIESSMETSGGTHFFESRIVSMDRYCALCISRDVTERRRHEDALVGSIHEKERLLREIHHRVKNNLQVISSLVNLQGERFRDEEDRRLMHEMQQRIQSMAQLHELFYESPDQARIDMRGYLVGLVDELRAAYRVHPGHISAEILVEPLCFGLETALPVGLIVNELVANAFLHAFSGPRTGTVSVSLSADDGGFALEVSDDGIGLPAGFDNEASMSLGWLLVNSLVVQLDGKLTLVSGPGTTVRISAPLISRRSP